MRSAVSQVRSIPDFLYIPISLKRENEFVSKSHQTVPFWDHHISPNLFSRGSFFISKTLFRFSSIPIKHRRAHENEQQNNSLSLCVYRYMRALVVVVCVESLIESTTDVNNFTCSKTQLFIIQWKESARISKPVLLFDYFTLQETDCLPRAVLDDALVSGIKPALDKVQAIFI